MKRFLLSAVVALALAGSAFADFTTTATPVHPNGTRAQIDLPTDQHMRNIGGSDGAGLCVGTSQEVAGRWQNLKELNGFQAWLHKRPGGSMPRWLARDIPLFVNSKGQKVPPHIQHEGGDVEFLRLALKTRRMVGITYAGCDPFYGTNTGIAHMVDAVHLADGKGAIIDNNQPGNWRWMDDSQLINRWLGKRDDGRDIMVTDGRNQFPVGGGWAVVWLGPPPPPVDRTAPDFLPEPSVPGSTSTFEEEMEQTIEPIPDVRHVRAPWSADKFIYGWQFADGIKVRELRPRMRYWVNGVEVDRRTAIGLLGATGEALADDSSKPFVSINGGDKAIVSALAPFADKVHINYYDDSSWVVKGRLKAKVVAQLAGGKTVFTSDTVTPEDAVKAAKKALGIVDPCPAPPKPEPAPEPKPVDPKPAPVDPPADPTKPKPTHVPGWLLMAGGYVLFRLSQRKVS